MDKVVRVKAIDRPDWSGMSRYPKCKDAISPYLTPRGGVETGLSKDNQERLEKEMKLTSGTLGRTSEYWTEYKIFMDEREKLIYTDTPEGELAYIFLLAHKRVANSLSERNEWPYADYIIYSEEEEASKENASLQVKIKAMSRFDNLSSEQKKAVLKLYGKRVNSNSSDELVYNTLAKYVESDPGEFIVKASDPHLATKVLIEDLLSINALRKNGGHFIFGDEVIAHDLESCIIHLEDPMNQSVLISLKKQLEAKSKR